MCKNVRSRGPLLVPLSVVGVTVAVELGVRAGLVDGAAALLDLPEGPAPVVMTFIVTADPVAVRPSIWKEDAQR